MDDIDRQLIGLLLIDARASVASLAKALGVSRGTVQNRMARLSANGTIVGYTVRLKPDAAEPRPPRRPATTTQARPPRGHGGDPADCGPEKDEVFRVQP